MKLTYNGPLEGVHIPALAVTARRGQTVDVPEAAVDELLAAGWTKPVKKSTAKKAPAKKAAAAKSAGRRRTAPAAQIPDPVTDPVTEPASGDDITTDPEV